jgi:hypothetical protein
VFDGAVVHMGGSLAPSPREVNDAENAVH